MWEANYLFAVEAAWGWKIDVSVDDTRVGADGGSTKIVLGRPPARRNMCLFCTRCCLARAAVEK